MVAYGGSSSRYKLSGHRQPLCGHAGEHVRQVDDVVQHHGVGDQVHVLHLLELLHRVAALDHRATEADPVQEVVVGLDLGGLGADALAQLGLGHEAQQEQGPHHTPQLAEGLVEPVLPAAAAELAQQHRGQHLAGLDRQDHLHHVLPVRLDDPPVDGLGEERVDVIVLRCGVRPVELGVVPGPHARQQLDAEQVCQAENRLALAMGVGVDGVDLELRAILKQPVEDVDRLPDPAGDEVAEQRDVGRRNVMVGDAAVAAITDVLLAEEVVLAQLHVGPVGDRHVRLAPELGQLEPGILAGDVGGCGFELVDGDMLGVDPAQRVPVDAVRCVARGLVHAEVAADPEDREQIPLGRVLQLGIRARQWAEVARERRPVLDVLEDIEQMPLWHPFPDRLLEGLEPLRQRLSGLADQMRRPIRIDPQRAVVREAGVHGPGQLFQLVSQLGDEPAGLRRQLHRGAVVVEPAVALVPRQQLSAVVVVGPGADHIQVAALQRLGQVHEHAKLQGMAVEQDRAVLPLLDEGLPALRGEAKIQCDVQDLAAAALVLADDIQGVQQARVRVRRLQRQQIEQAEQRTPVATVDRPQQRQVVVVVVGGHRVVLGAEGLDAALFEEHLAQIAAEFLVRVRSTGMSQDLAEDREELFLDRALVLLQRVQPLDGPIPSAPHPADEHLDELIAGLGLGLVKQAQQQSVSPPRLADIT